MAVAALAMGAAGCSPKEPPSDEATGASISELNSNPQITNFAVYAQNSATLRDRTALASGDVGVRLKGTGPFLVTGYELALVAGVQVDTTHNVIANRVLLQGAKVGDVQTNTLTIQNGGTYTKKYAFPTTMPALPTPAPVFAGTAALTVNPSSTVVALPGAYGAVSIGTKGILRLQGGVYHLASLQLDDEARIEAQAAVQIRVAGRVSGRLSTLARVWIGAASGVTLTAADLRIEVSGKNGGNGTPTDTPMAAAFGNDATILGVILVPNGTLQIGQRNIVTGALVGRDVYVDMDSKVNFQSGVGVLKCAQFCNDGNPCTKDTCTGEVCSYPSAASGTSCSDGNACNGAETCDGAGKCKAGTPVSCTALDQCHAPGVCDPGSGVCSNPAKSDGTQCDDKNPCTVSDICRAGTCSGTTYSCDDGLACTTDTCNGTGGCTHTVTANNCAINGACYAAGATNPTNACQQCAPGTSQTAWSLKSKGTVCRAAAGPCDKAEVCDGTGAGCPPDGYAPSSTLCRASAGPCDLPETCTGSSAACPADALAPVTTVCRASTGPCDLAEMCTGASAACPADAFVPPTTVCRASAGPCDVAETCTGSNPACPADGFLQASLACRPAVGPCDAVETCSGISAACPPDALQPASMVCRASTGACDPAETCTGTSTSCPADVVTGAPAVPSSLTATDGSGQASLAWSASPGATNYNVKRSTTSGGAYATIASPMSSPFTDTGLASGTTYYYVVTAVSACGESANSNEVSVTSAGPPLAVKPPRRLPAPPRIQGCYVGTWNGWLTVPCTPLEQLPTAFQLPPAPDIGGAAGVIGISDSNATTPLQFGQVEVSLADIQSESDSSGVPNTLSLQANTNFFTASKGYVNTGDQGWVQFTLRSIGGDSTHQLGGIDQEFGVCVWNINVTTKPVTFHADCLGPNYTVVSNEVTLGVQNRDLRPGDYASVAGSAFIDQDGTTHDLGVVAQLSWWDPTNDPSDYRGLYAVVTTDMYGLMDNNNWTQVSGTMLGFGGSSKANFTNSTLITKVLAGSCANYQGTPPPNAPATTPWPGACPNSLLPTTDTQVFPASLATAVTAESNNLISGATAAIASLPNDHSYVFTQYCASTSGKTTFTPRVFVRDHDQDNASTPSNLGGQAFWMSPDIILVTSGATGVTKNSISSVSSVTAGATYDIYVRAHNELGCAAVNGVKARVMYANPSALSTDWHDIDSNSTGAYLGTTDPTGHPSLANGLNIAASDYDILGPFAWTVPTNIDSPHQCLLVDIMAGGGENAPSSDPSVVGNMFDAPNSYQVAQRNLEVGNNCSYSLVDGTGAGGQLTLTLQATSGGQPYPPTSGDMVRVTFDDPNQQWGLSWPGGGTTGYTNSYDPTGGAAGTGATTIQLLQGQVTLPAVTMNAGDSRNVASYVLPEFGSGTTIDMNLGASLAVSSTPGGSGGLSFTVTNGLTCEATAATEIIVQ